MKYNPVSLKKNKKQKLTKSTTTSQGRRCMQQLCVNELLESLWMQQATETALNTVATRALRRASKHPICIAHPYFVFSLGRKIEIQFECCRRSDKPTPQVPISWGQEWLFFSFNLPWTQFFDFFLSFFWFLSISVLTRLCSP